MRHFERLVDGVIGGWYGDESKALTVARMAQTGEYDYVARYNGGNNAGGQVFMDDGRHFKFNTLPAGLIFGVPAILGKGVLINTQAVFKEIEEKREQGLQIDEGNLSISGLAKLILPEHIYMDKKRERGKDKQGSTQKGISPAAASQYGRNALTADMVASDLKSAEKRVREGIYEVISGGKPSFDTYKQSVIESREWAEQTRELFAYIKDTDELVMSELLAGKRILAEGAQSIGLALEGADYPYVTSSHPGPSGIPIGLGCNVEQLDEMVAVLKATPTRVGEGDFDTEIDDPKIAKNIRGERGSPGSEYGTVTGRERRVGWPNLTKQDKLLVAHGISKVALTKLDCVPEYGDEVFVVVGYDADGKPIYESHATWTEDISGVKKFSDLPANARDHVNLYSEALGVDIVSVGVGPSLEQVIYP